jgi:RimJ/RimL family protein N-acetyltransferase
MLKGTLVGLRARHEEDVPVLREELYNDVVTDSRSSRHPWRPIGPGSADKRVSLDEPPDDRVRFSVVALADGELLGVASLWGIDTLSRTAHLGMGLRPGARGKGYGTDMVRTLCWYGFVVRGLHRLQLETLADNVPMQRAAERNGFVREGVLRSSAYVLGVRLDEVVYGLLASEFAADA